MASASNELLYTPADLRARVQGLVDRAGSRTALARSWRVHRSVIDDVVNGGPPTPRVIERLGMQLVPRYRRRRAR